MAETLALEVVTPKGSVLKRAVLEVTAPGHAGQLGVLPGHVPTMAALRSGIITLREETGEERYAVSYGFLEIGPDHAVLLTERFSARDDVDVVATRTRLQEVDAAIDAFQGDPSSGERKLLLEEEQWLGTLLELIGDPPPALVREDTRFIVRHPEPVSAEEAHEARLSDASLTGSHDPHP